ncbi:MAG: hypothetical protein IKN12_06355 [Selenomonadaceae bacterium]|nr:hypothetical protein [Selenomonadaceae bacterium]
MIDHFVVLPPETEKLLKRLIALYKKHRNNETLYKQGLNEIAKDYSDIEKRISTLVKCGYLEDDNMCMPTDVGFSYTYIKRHYFEERYLLPAIISFIVAVATTLVTLWLKGLL